MPERDARWAYEVLGLPFGATASATQQAYRDLIAVWHPDRFTDNARRKDLAHKKTQDLNAAIALIRDLKPPARSATPSPAPPTPPPPPPLFRHLYEAALDYLLLLRERPDHPSVLEILGRGFFVVFGFGVMCLVGFDLVTGLFAGRLVFGSRETENLAGGRGAESTCVGRGPQADGERFGGVAVMGRAAQQGAERSE